MRYFSKFLTKLFIFFEVLMDGCLKNSSNIFSITPMDVSGWIKTDRREMTRFRKWPLKCVAKQSQ